MKGKVTWGNEFMIRYVTQGGWTEMLHFVTKRERTENDRNYRYVSFRGQTTLTFTSRQGKTKVF